MSNLMFVLAFKDAYYGQNTKIRDTLNNLILNVCASPFPPCPHWQ